MAHVIYNKESTIILCDRHSWEGNTYKTERAAKAALTRIENAFKADPNNRMARWDVMGGVPFDRNNFAIAEASVFHSTIEKKKTVRNLLSGKPVEIAVNTPLCCDPSSETYHCM